MRNIKLAGEKIFENEDRHSVQLSYYLLEDQRDLAGTPLYGIQVVKQVRDHGEIVKETETAAAISYSEAFVRQILFELIEHTVTPMCLLEVVDDMVTTSLHCSA